MNPVLSRVLVLTALGGLSAPAIIDLNDDGLSDLWEKSSFLKKKLE